MMMLSKQQQQQPLLATVDESVVPNNENLQPPLPPSSSSRPFSIRRAFADAAKLPFLARSSNLSEDSASSSKPSATATSATAFATNTLARYRSSAAGDRDSDLSSAAARSSLLFFQPEQRHRFSNLSSDSASASPRSSALKLPSQALTAVLRDPVLKQRFRTSLAQFKMAETLDCWDAIEELRAASNQLAHYQDKLARRIMERFVLDNAPEQVNLSSSLRDRLCRAYYVSRGGGGGGGDGEGDGEDDDYAFRDAAQELFRDLRQSDVLRTFLEHDALAMSLGNRGI